MRLFYLVEQHHRIRLSAHRLGQLSALVVSYVSGRRADKTGYREFFHILGHVYPDEVVLVVEQALRKRLGKFRLAHARGTQEHERTYRTVRVRDPRAGADYRLGYLGNRLVLTYNALMEDFVQMQYLFAFAFHKLVQRDPRPARDNSRDLLFGHGVAKQRMFLAARFYRFVQPLLEFGQLAVLEFGGFGIIAHALRFLDLAVFLLDLRFQVADKMNTLLFALPLYFHFVESVLLFGKFLADIPQSLFGKVVRLLIQSHFLDLELHYPSRDVVHFLRHGIDLGTDRRGSFVHEVYRLVGQETVGDIPVRKRRRRYQRRIVDLYAVIHFVSFLQSAQYGYGVLDARFVHGNGLETTLQRGVFFYILSVFVQSGRADTVQFASRQHRL